MSNIHNPVRYENETQAEYRERRAKGNAAANPAHWLHENRVQRRSYANPERDRRARIKAMGGIRQFNRARTAPLRAIRDAALSA